MSGQHDDYYDDNEDYDDATIILRMMTVRIMMMTNGFYQANILSLSSQLDNNDKFVINDNTSVLKHNFGNLSVNQGATHRIALSVQCPFACF